MHCHHLGSFPGLPSFWFVLTQDSIQKIQTVPTAMEITLCMYSPTNEA